MVALDVTRTFAVVPVKNQWHLTAGIIACVAPQVDDLLVIDNGSTDDTLPRLRRVVQSRTNVHHKRMPGRSIYECWNAGFARARKAARGEAFHVLITNNDIELGLHAVTALSVALSYAPGVWASYPDYDATTSLGDAWGGELRRTRGVLGQGGLFGACFMLAGERIPWSPLITDLSYAWWWGDNHLAECIEQEGGQQARCVGLAVRHENEGTARHEDQGELYRRKLADRGRWLTREARGPRAILR